MKVFNKKNIFSIFFAMMLFFTTVCVGFATGDATEPTATTPVVETVETTATDVAATDEAVVAETEETAVETAEEDEDPRAENSWYYASLWALIPPLVAIALALITKEVYSSLFVASKITPDNIPQKEKMVGKISILERISLFSIPVFKKVYNTSFILSPTKKVSFSSGKKCVVSKSMLIVLSTMPK